MSTPKVEELLTSYFGRVRESDAEHSELETLARAMSLSDQASREKATALIASNRELAEVVLLVSGDPGGVQRRGGWGKIAGFLALAAAIAAVILTRPPRDTSIELTPKGRDDRLEIAVQRGEARFRVRPNDRIATGDQLGFFYTAPSAGHLALLTMDENGKVEVLSNGTIRAGSEIALPDGAIADEGSGCEWIIAVFSNAALSLSDVESQIAGATRESSGCRLEPVVSNARSVRVIPLVR